MRKKSTVCKSSHLEHASIAVDIRFIIRCGKPIYFFPRWFHVCASSENANIESPKFAIINDKSSIICSELQTNVTAVHAIKYKI